MGVWGYKEGGNVVSYHQLECCESRILGLTLECRQMSKQARSCGFMASVLYPACYSCFYCYNERKSMAMYPPPSTTARLDSMLLNR